MGLLRFLLALDILISHFPATSIGRYLFLDDAVAVKTFFILSGFYISLILSEKYNTPGGYRVYLTNRFLRLLPAFWVVLLLTIIGSGVSGIFFDNWGRLLPYLDYWDKMTWEASGYLIISNIFLVGQDLIRFMFLDLANGTLGLTPDYMGHTPIMATFMFVPQAWSLGIELVFYAVAPLFVSRDQRVLVILLVAILGGRYWFTSMWQLPQEPWKYGFFPFELSMFILGILAYQVYLKIRDRHIPKSFFWGLYLFVVFVTLIWDFLPGITIKTNSYYGLFSLALPFLFAGRQDGWLQRKLGDLSYPIYVSHILVRDVLLVLCQSSLLVPYVGILSAIATMIFSIALHHFIVMPIETYRQQRALSIRNNLRYAALGK
ncbi:MAG: acyltransferase [Proteobacteria bacterium]|nr:acyltransferase [Pseudomonadota bacterium]